MLKESFGFIKIPTPSLLLLVPQEKRIFSPFFYPFLMRSLPRMVFPVANRLSIVYLLARRKLFLVWFIPQSSYIICTYLEIHLLISESYQKRQDSGEKGREEIQNMLFNIQIL